ncbi:1935_t:CDS:2, partial [Acaulospora colombiana]
MCGGISSNSALGLLPSLAAYPIRASPRRTSKKVKKKPRIMHKPIGDYQRQEELTDSRADTPTRTSIDHNAEAEEEFGALRKTAERFAPRTITQRMIAESSTSNSAPSSQPPSRSVSPAPHKATRKDPYGRFTQMTIDGYSPTPSFTAESFQQLVELSKAQNNDEASTPTQSTAPSECDSQDSERSSVFLRVPEMKRKRTSSSARTAGERDDGALRPTTFWKNTPRSALASPAYSPSTHLIRQAQFVAAGVEMTEPSGDIAAL